MKLHLTRRIAFFLAGVTLTVVMAAAIVPAQTDDDAAQAMEVAAKLVQQNEFEKALPFLAIVVKAEPDDPDVHALYGLSLMFASKMTDDVEVAKSRSALSLSEFRLAKKLGSTREEVDTFIAILTGKGGAPQGPKAGGEDFEKAEGFFAQSKYDEALTYYKKALAANPKYYEAALYSADCLMQLQKYDEAEKYYQTAITIDPERETAYRYSATYLMKQKKYDQARDRYVEAYIVEPYSGMSARGITQWATATNSRLGHPKVTIPAMSVDAAGKAQLKDGTAQSPVSNLWLEYAATRNTWQKEKFAKTFPNESGYRHTVEEEVEALRSVIAASNAKKVSDDEVDVLKKIDADGMLDAFVYISMPDEAISNAYGAYLKDNRPKLRSYVVKYVIHK